MILQNAPEIVGNLPLTEGIQIYDLSTITIFTSFFKHTHAQKYTKTHGLSNKHMDFICEFLDTFLVAILPPNC